MRPERLRELLLGEDFEAARAHIGTSVADSAETGLLQVIVTLREGWARAEIHKPRPPDAAKPFIREKADDAIAALGDEAAEDPRRAWVLAEAYCLKLSLGNPIDVLKLGTRVERLYQKAAAALPGAPEVLVSWGAYGKLNAPMTFGGGPKNAAAKIEAALALDSTSAEAHALLGLCRLREKDLARARACLERALALAPGYAYAHRVLALVEEASAAKRGAVGPTKDTRKEG